MRCEVKESELLAYLLNEVSLEKKINIEKHLQNCTECSDRLMDLDFLQEAWSTPDYSYELDQRFTERVIDQLSIKHENNQENRKLLSFNSKKFSSLTNFTISSAAVISLLITGKFTDALTLFHHFSLTFNETAVQFQIATGQGLAWLNTLSFYLTHFLNNPMSF